jgi:hypothetical protein
VSSARQLSKDRASCSSKLTLLEPGEFCKGVLCSSSSLPRRQRAATPLWTLQSGVRVWSSHPCPHMSSGSPTPFSTFTKGEMLSCSTRGPNSGRGAIKRAKLLPPQAHTTNCESPVCDKICAAPPLPDETHGGYHGTGPSIAVRHPGLRLAADSTGVSLGVWQQLDSSRTER